MAEAKKEEDLIEKNGIDPEMLKNLNFLKNMEMVNVLEELEFMETEKVSIKKVKSAKGK